MVADQLSEVFGLVEVEAAVSSVFTTSPPWVAGGPVGHPLKFIALARGQAVLRTDAGGSHELAAGDIAVLRGRAWLELRDDRGEGPVRRIDVTAPPEPDGVDRADLDVVLGGHIDLNETGRALLAETLPPVGHVRASGDAAGAVRRSLDRVVDEMTDDRPGSAFAVRQHAQLLVLELLRAWVDQTDLPPGWLRALTDERLRPALRLLHAEPHRTWRLDQLARASAMSRTSFAEHFRATAGVPPLAYLHRWRMVLARRALRDRDDPVEAVATALGYGSDSAFSTAFKREAGESPLHYRRRVRHATR